MPAAPSIKVPPPACCQRFRVYVDVIALPTRCYQLAQLTMGELMGKTLIDGTYLAATQMPGRSNSACSS
jgi:hypothetical protein